MTTAFSLLCLLGLCLAPVVLSVPPPAVEQQCARECMMCETVVAPRIRAAALACPDCRCARQLANTSCPDAGAKRFCVQGEARDARGCPTGRCAHPAALPGVLAVLRHCPKLCPSGYRRDAASGLPVCACACPLEETAPAERLSACAAHCPGRHAVLVRQPDSDCFECRCGARLARPCPPLLCHLDCGAAGHMADVAGCPVCACAGAAYAPPTRPAADSDIPLCPESLSYPADSPRPSSACPNACPAGLRLYDGQRNCQRCECCPDISQRCPDLECGEQAVDGWGCPVCACKEPNYGPALPLVEEGEPFVIEAPAEAEQVIHHDSDYPADPAPAHETAEALAQAEAIRKALQPEAEVVA